MSFFQGADRPFSQFPSVVIVTLRISAAWRWVNLSARRVARIWAPKEGSPASFGGRWEGGAGCRVSGEAGLRKTSPAPAREGEGWEWGMGVPCLVFGVPGCWAT